MSRHTNLLIILLFSTIPFVVIAFTPYHHQGKELNRIYAYLYHEGSFIANHLSAFILGFIVLTLIWIRYKESHPHASWHKKHSISLMQAACVSIAGFSLSYVVVVFIAIFTLNILSITITIRPALAGLTTDKKIIVQTLEKRRNPVEIIISNDKKNSALYAIAIASADKDSFYGHYILPSIPTSFAVPANNLDSSLVLLGNTVIITKINPQDIQTLSPVLGYHLVKQYFPQRVIKAYPKIVIANREDYAGYRKTSLAKKITRIDEALLKNDREMTALQDEIQKSTASIAISQEEIKQVLSQRDAQYKECVSKGRYESGVFKREFSPEYCKNLRSTWNVTANQGENRINERNLSVQHAQKTLADKQFYQNFLRTQKELLIAYGGTITRELGFFEPTDSIVIAQDVLSHAIRSEHVPSAQGVILNGISQAIQTSDVTDKNNKELLLADYLAALTHEYLHYASYISSEQRLYSAFFEEGLTEYFARKVVQESIHADTQVGYPVQTKIITEMMDLITEREFADIYFTKNEVQLEETLDRVFGQNFYKNSLSDFETLHYTSDPNQMMKLANELMTKIGGEPITENDILNNFSNK